MNETGNPKDSRAEAVPFPRDWRAFKKWREAQGFTGIFASKAETVENDLRLIGQLDPVINANTIAVCERNVQEFATMLEAQG